MPRQLRRQTLRLSHPKTARAVARSAKTAEQFGANLRNWFHELKRISTRAALLQAVKTRPPSVAARFAGGEVSDAYLAAQVEWLCRRAGIPPPAWTRDPAYVLDEPWFSIPGKAIRAHLLLDTPTEFRNRNVFTTPECTVTIRRGRPTVSADIKREKTRLRMQRLRARRRAKEAP